MKTTVKFKRTFILEQRVTHTNSRDVLAG